MGLIYVWLQFEKGVVAVLPIYSLSVVTKQDIPFFFYSFNTQIFLTHSPMCLLDRYFHQSESIALIFLGVGI